MKAKNSAAQSVDCNVNEKCRNLANIFAAISEKIVVFRLAT